MTAVLGSCLQMLPEKLLSSSQKKEREKTARPCVTLKFCASSAPPMARARLLTHHNLLTAYLLNLVLRLAGERVGVENVNSCILA